MLDRDNFAAVLKEVYDQDYVQDLTYPKSPALALIKKNENMKGKKQIVPIQYGNPQGRSQNFARAQARARATSGLYEAFEVTRVRDYGIVTIDNETMLASEGDAYAFLSGKTTEIDGIFKSIAGSTSSKIYRNGVGAIGRVGSNSFGVLTIDLENADDVVNFELQMELMVAASDTSGTTRATGSSGNGLIIQKINRQSGQLTFAANVNDAGNGIPTIAQGDYIYVRGDRNETGSFQLLNLAGFEAWLPASGPSATPFFGVDRTVDSGRLAGQTYDGVGKPLEEVLIDGAGIVGREGGALDYYLTSWQTWRALEKQLGSRVQYVDVMATPSIGFRGLVVQGGDGPINVLPDRFCPTNRIFGLQLDTWELGSLGKLPRLLNADGNDALRMADGDGIEIRAGYYGNLWCNAPGWNINIQI